MASCAEMPLPTNRWVLATTFLPALNQRAASREKRDFSITITLFHFAFRRDTGPCFTPLVNMPQVITFRSNLSSANRGPIVWPCRDCVIVHLVNTLDVQTMN